MFNVDIFSLFCGQFRGKVLMSEFRIEIVDKTMNHLPIIN